MGPIRIHLRPSFRFGLLLLAALGAWRSTVATPTGAPAAAANPAARSQPATDDPRSNPASDRIASPTDDDRLAADGDLTDDLDDDDGDDAIGAGAIVLSVFAPASPACVPARGECPTVFRDALFRPPRASA